MTSSLFVSYPHVTSRLRCHPPQFGCWRSSAFTRNDPTQTQTHTKFIHCQRPHNFSISLSLSLSPHRTRRHNTKVAAAAFRAAHVFLLFLYMYESICVQVFRWLPLLLVHIYSVQSLLCRIYSRIYEKFAALNFLRTTECVDQMGTP